MYSIKQKVCKTAVSCLFIAILGSVLVFNTMFDLKQTQASVLGLPEPTQLLKKTDDYDMPVLKGMRLDPSNPLKMEFILDAGQEKSVNEADSQRLLKYFLAALTTSNDNLWVNLSPYESERVIEQRLGTTEMGRDMLAQDYILKQLSASLTHPDTKSGKQYWSSINDITNVGSFDKIWIIPEVVEISEQNGLVLINKASLDVKTEADYLAIDKNTAQSNADPLRDTVLPTIKEEVNSGKHFHKLRQIYHSIILANWFKQKFADSFYSQYMNQNKVSGIDLEDKTAKDSIYRLYCQAFEAGVYNMIKKERNQQSDEFVKRKYFGGGLTFSSAVAIAETESNIIDIKKISSSVKTPKLLTMTLKPLARNKLTSIAVLLSAMALHALELINGTPNTIGILKDSTDAVQVRWDAQGKPHINNSRGAANQFAPNNPYDMWSWGQFMNMITPIDSIDDQLKAAGHNSNKVYYAAENLNAADKAKLKAHTNKIYKDNGIASMFMHFGGQYATNGKDNFLLANPTAANLDVVRERVRDFANFCNEIDVGALSGVQLFNEPMFYQAGASSMHWGDAHYAQIGFKSAEEFYDFANELAGIFKSICPTVPVYYGHGFLEPAFISKIKGRLTNFDAIALNLYPNYPMGSKSMSVDDLITYFRSQVELAYNELGLPVVISEFAESSTSKNNDPNWGQNDQAQFAANVMRALSIFMFGSDSQEKHTVIGAFWHELFPEAWKDAAIAPTESGLSLYAKDYKKKLAADSLGQGFIRIDSLEQNIDNPVNIKVKSKKNAYKNNQVNKFLVLKSMQSYTNDSFDVPVTVNIHDLKGRLLGSFNANKDEEIDPYIANLNLPMGNYVINIKPLSSSIFAEPLMAFDNALSLFEQHRAGIIERKQVHVDNVNNALSAFLNKNFDYLNPEEKGSTEYLKYSELLEQMYDNFMSMSTVEQNALILGTNFHDIGARNGMRDMDHNFIGVDYIKENLTKAFDGNQEFMAKTSFIIAHHSFMSNIGTDYLAADLAKLSKFEKDALVLVSFFDVGARADGSNLYRLNLLQGLLDKAYSNKGSSVENMAEYRVKHGFCPDVMMSYAISNTLDSKSTETLVKDYKDILDSKLRVKSFGLFTQLLSLDVYTYKTVLEMILKTVDDKDIQKFDDIIVDTDIDFMALPVAKMTMVAKKVQSHIMQGEKLNFIKIADGKHLKLVVELDEIASSAFGGIELSDIEFKHDASSSIVTLESIDLGEFDGLEPVDIKLVDIDSEDIMKLIEN